MIKRRDNNKMVGIAVAVPHLNVIFPKSIKPYEL
jgi:hypothetical protein